MISTADTANSFWLAAQRCEEHRQINESQYEALLVPAVTNRAFSVELYLKALLEIEGNSIRSHDLFKIFNKLDVETQKKIIKATRHEEDAFMIKLKTNAQLFEEWRYVYEKDDIQVAWAFLKTLVDAVRCVFNAEAKNA